MKKFKAYVILDNIRSVHNVGSIFRTADAAGISGIYLCGVTPTPLDRFGFPRKDLAKVALGAEKNVPWFYEKDTAILVQKLKKQKIIVVAVEQDKDSVDYKSVSLKNDIAFIFGNEVGGISREILRKSDVVCEIPMKGEKESLNVSVSAGVILFRVLGI